MRARAILTWGGVGLVLIGAMGWWFLDSQASPGCASEPALRQVTDALREQFHLDGVFVNNIRTVSGGWFSDRRACSAEVAEIRGNVNASDMAWREIQYRIDQAENAERPSVAVTLGGAVPLAKPVPSLWERLFGRS